MRPAPPFAAALVAAALAACAAKPPKAPLPPPAPTPPHEADPSFDWQALVIATIPSVTAVPDGSSSLDLSWLSR